jgi:hypothetical protein
VRREAPWWLGWLLASGLVALFVGERVLPGFTLVRALFSGLGALAVLGSAAWRAATWGASSGEARRVQGWLLLAHLGCVLALIGYLLSSDDGMGLLGIEFADAEARDRYVVVMQVLWTILLAVSLLPILGAQLALAEHRHAQGQAAGIEAYRVLETATAGLTVALAAALLFVVGGIASARDEVLDLSYFRTATPGPSTIAMISGLDEPLRVLLFFPEVNPVKDEALRYFRELADATGRVTIEEHDRLAEPRLAEQHQVVQDGTIVILRGDQPSSFDLGSTLASARPLLRGLDRRFQTVLMPILRRRQGIYLTSGHGELNDSTGRAVSDAPLGGVSALRDLLGYVGYDPRDLGLSAGSGSEVPADAAAVLVLGPRRPFLAEEIAALERYLDRGGSLLLALDPSGDFSMGDLERRLGVRYVPVPLADEEQHLRQRGDDSDRRLLITDRYTSHESVTTLARAGPGTAVLMLSPGYLEAADGADPAPRFVVRSLPSAFADENEDFRFDEGSETQEAYPLVAAVELAAAGSDSAPVTDSLSAPDSATAADTAAVSGAAALGEAAAPRSARVLVYATSAPFTDAVLVSIANNAALISDGVRWLAGEEELAGAVATEEDVPIVHTQEQNVIWFYGTILGAPALVLAFGLIGVQRRRQRKGEA